MPGSAATDPRRVWAGRSTIRAWLSASYFLVISVKIGTPKTSNFTFETFSE